MLLKDVYELIPWDVLKEWAESVKFDDDIINTNFPKYKNWSPKAIYADYLMDYVDEGFNAENMSYPKAIALKGKDIADLNFMEIYKLYFDSYLEDESKPGSRELKRWQQRLADVAGTLKEACPSN